MGLILDLKSLVFAICVISLVNRWIMYLSTYNKQSKSTYWQAVNCQCWSSIGWQTSVAKYVSAIAPAKRWVSCNSDKLYMERTKNHSIWITRLSLHLLNQISLEETYRNRNLRRWSRHRLFKKKKKKNKGLDPVHRKLNFYHCICISDTRVQFKA